MNEKNHVNCIFNEKTDIKGSRIEQRKKIKTANIVLERNTDIFHQIY